LTWFSGSYTTKPTRKRALNDDSDFRFGEATVSASVYVKYGPQIASKVGFESGKTGGGYFQQEKVEWRCPTIPLVMLQQGPGRLEQAVPCSGRAA